MPDRTKRSRIGVHAVRFAPGRKTVDRGHFRTHVRLNCIAAVWALSSSEVQTAAAMEQKVAALQGKGATSLWLPWRSLDAAEASRT